jgi:hypothetical protein
VTNSRTITSTPTTSSTPTLNPGNGKRGLAYSNNTYTHYFAVTGQNSSVSWAYNYFSLPDTNYGGLNPALTFIPMLFNDNPTLTNVFAANVNASITNYGTDAILSFNEPDSCFGGSACMTVSASVAAYKAYIQPFAGRVLLGAPAVTNGGSPGSLTYLANFIGNCTGCTIDFVPIHWYASAYNIAYFEQYIAQAYNVSGGRPLWVTEWGMDQDYYDPDVQTFLKASMAFLDNTTYVQRYAYFGAYAGELQADDFGKGLLINNAGTGLSAEGVIFNNYTGP